MDNMLHRLSGHEGNMFMSYYPGTDYDDVDILDGEGGTLFGAYSLNRRLISTYSGDAFQIERHSDSTSKVIPFEADGSVDHSEITSFCTGTTCSVRTWYDQIASNAANYQQTTQAYQLVVYENGAVNTYQGRIMARMAYPGSGAGDYGHHMTWASSKTHSTVDFEFMCAGTIDVGTTKNTWLVSHSSPGHENPLAAVDTVFDVYKVFGERTTTGLGGFHVFRGRGYADGTNDSDLDKNIEQIGWDEWDDVDDLQIRIGHPPHVSRKSTDGKLSEIIMYADTMPTDYTNIRDNMIDYYKVT